MIYRFGVFEFDPRDGALRRDGRAVPLEPKPARALALLLERAGELVSRDELRAALWEAGTHVDFDRSLAYCLGQVRQALGDSGDNPRYVLTVPRRGFKFIAPVAEAPLAVVHSAARAAASVARPAPSRSRPPYVIVASVSSAVVVIAALAWLLVQSRLTALPVVAVALFDNETGNAAFDRPLSRMTDAVVERLTALGTNRIGVVGNHALLRTPRAGRNLDAIARDIAASHVVLVQLQPRAPELSLLLQLIRLDDGFHIWVRREAVAAADLDRVDDEIASRIEAAIRRYVLNESVEAP